MDVRDFGVELRPELRGNRPTKCRVESRPQKWWAGRAPGREIHLRSPPPRGTQSAASAVWTPESSSSVSSSAAAAWVVGISASMRDFGQPFCTLSMTSVR